MIGMRENPAASSAFRIPATRPSIISLGATMSMPARACVTATLPSRYTDASLSTSPSCTTPQCPWSVYSHRQASPITSSSGAARFTARAACCTIPCSSYAPEPARLLGILHELVHRGLKDTRQRGDFPPHALAVAHEQGPYELRGDEVRLLHEAAQRGRAAQPTHAADRELAHRPSNLDAPWARSKPATRRPAAAGSRSSIPAEAVI